MKKQVTMKKTLGLTGVTMNAMALIAPGAFLWLTFQMQAGQVIGGKSTAMDMFPGLAFALILALLTAISYAKLATLYPEAGTGSSYYFAEQAFMSSEKFSVFSRIDKFVVGWFSHLYYWVYPGLMAGMFAVLISYIAGQFGVNLPLPVKMFLAACLAAATGFVAYHGVTGSTAFSIIINIIQMVTILFLSILAFTYRIANPQHVVFVHKSILDIIVPHSFSGMLFQSTISILLLVGFESATALAAESKSIQCVSRGTVLSLLLQGLVFYFIEYIAANSWMNTSYTVNGRRGYAAAAESSAPIGDMMRNLGDTLFHGSGFTCMILVAVSVAVAVVGSMLSCMNTGVRVTYAMAKDDEMPTVLNALHGKYATPYAAIRIITVISAAVGALSVINITALTTVTLISNIGTFLLYGMTNLIALVAQAHQPRKNPLTAVVIPVLGTTANAGMLIAVVVMGIFSGGVTETSALLAIGVSLAWLAVGIVYFRIHSRNTGKEILVHKTSANA